MVWRHCGAVRCSETQLALACSIPRDSLISFGVCFGKFTKSRKFVLKITCLDYLAEHAKVPCLPVCTSV